MRPTPHVGDRWVAINETCKITEMKFNRIIQAQVTDLFTSSVKFDSPGFAVGIVYDKNVVFSEGFGQATLEHFSPITSETVFDIGSMAKQFVGMAIAILEEEGQLSIGDKIQKYLPEYPEYAKEITLADLLYHTSGIRNYTVLAYYMLGYHESDAITKEEVYDLLLRLRSLNFEPGDRWEYSDSNYFLLAKIIERVSGKSLNSFTKEVIFHPLDMQNTLFRECHSQIIRNRAIGYVNYPIAFRSPYLYREQQESMDSFHTLISNYEHVGAEGLFTTLGDLIKWDQNFSDNRLGKGNFSLVERVLSPGIQINAEVGYGFGLNIGSFKGKKFFGHDGAIHGYTSSMMHFPEEKVSVICLANHNLVGAWEYRNRIVDLIFPNSNLVTSSIPSLHHEEEHLDEQEIIGSYQNPETASIWEVFCKDRTFFVRVNDTWEFEIHYEEPFVYRATHPNMELRFEANSDGTIKEVNCVVSEQHFTFVPFLQNILSTDDLMEYVGKYHSEELGATFIVDAKKHGLVVRNNDRHFCSMDLFYEPTIRDSFKAYDPHPISSQISFLREGANIEAFVYRDYDGDGREAIKFTKVGRPRNPVSTCSLA